MVLGGVLPAFMALTANTQASGAGSGGVGGTLRAGCNTGLENIYKLGLIIHFLLPIVERFLFCFEARSKYLFFI